MRLSYVSRLTYPTILCFRQINYIAFNRAGSVCKHDCRKIYIVAYLFIEHATNRL